MKLVSFTIVALGALLFTGAAAHATAKSCLTGTDPSVATDPTQIAAVRVSIDSSCLCNSFDGSKGHKHADYVKCAKGVIGAAAKATQLRTQCKATVTKYYSVSTCGLLADPPSAPCITKSTKGVVKCAIKPTAKCKGTVCSGFTTCVDASDTNTDGLIDKNDSGSCNAIGGTPTPTAPTATPTPTHTSVPPPANTPTHTPTPGATPIQFTASMDGAQAGTGSTATGSCTGTLNAAQTSFSIMCTHNVVGANMAHIHQGAPGVSGGIVFPFASGASPLNGTFATTPSQASTLIAGGYYVNVHSGTFIGGEIRGQVLMVP